MIRFGFDGDAAEFSAHGAGTPWNGWLCPIVSRQVLGDVLDRLKMIDDERNVELSFDAAGVATVREYERGGDSRTPLGEFDIAPDGHGLYLLNLGLALAAC
ncbi:MAG: hypothetical protein WDA07_13600 [Leucobacter sp.]